MKLLYEFEFDMDFANPRVSVSGKNIVIENVKDIKLITDSVVTVSNGQSYVTAEGNNFVVKELCERRLVIEGEIQRVEFLRRKSAGKDRGL